MDRLKELINKYGRWIDLSRHINRVEYQIDSDLVASIGSAKSLLESICKTILDYENQNYKETDDIQALITKTIKLLKLENPNPVASLGSSLINAMKAIGELRNKIDESSHGKSLLKSQKIELITASFLVSSVETVACFLIEFYEIEHPRKKEEEDKFSFEDKKDFNDYIDNEHGYVEIAKIPYSTSEALFAIDITAYQDEYRKYLEVANEQTN